MLAIASNVSAQPPLKPEEQAATILNAGDRAHNEKPWIVATDRYRESAHNHANQQGVH